MTVLDDYHTAGMRLAQVVDMYWETILVGRERWSTDLVQQLLDRYRDACSDLARATQEVDE